MNKINDNHFIHDLIGKVPHLSISDIEKRFLIKKDWDLIDEKIIRSVDYIYFIECDIEEELLNNEK